MADTAQDNSFRVVRGSGADLRVDIGTRLLVSSRDLQGNCRGEVVGLQPYDFLMVKVPYLSDLRTTFVIDDYVVGRYLHKGTVFGFRSVLLHLVTKPAPILFLEYPGGVEKYELRRHKRQSCLLPVNVHLSLGIVHGLIMDISKSGCRVTLKDLGPDAGDAVKPDDMLMVETGAFSEGGKKQLLESLVRRIDRDNGSIILGLEFRELDKATLKHIDNYLSVAGDVTET